MGTFRLTVRKDMDLSWPFAESATHLMSIGLDEDLDDAAKQAVREMIKHICERTNLLRNQAYMAVFARRQSSRHATGRWQQGHYCRNPICEQRKIRCSLGAERVISAP